MRIPRDISGRELAKKLNVFGYTVTRQSGSHIRLTTQQQGEHHVTIPDHDSLRIGTFNSVIDAVAGHFRTTKEEILREIL